MLDTFFIFIFIFLIILSGFFSGSEIAYFNLKPHHGDIPEKLKNLLSKPRQLLVSILTGNTLINVAIGSLAALITTSRISSSPDIILLEVLIVSLVLIIFGEILPKTLAMKFSKGFANMVYIPLRLFIVILSPITFFLNLINQLVLKLFPKHEKEFDTEEELEILADLGEEKGGLEEEESDMIRSIIKFDDKTVREIMTPRVDILGLSGNASLDNAMDLISEKQFSKIPVYKGSIDDITGILYAKDLVPYLVGSRPDIDLKSISRDVYFVPEQKPIDDLLNDFKERKLSLAIVVDEYGGTAGLATIEDVLEEIVGEIYDEHEGDDDEDEPVLHAVGEDVWEVDGRFHIDDFNEIVDSELPEDDEYDTVGGWFTARIGHVPAVGESFCEEQLDFQVLEAEPTRVIKLRVRRAD